MAAQNKNLHALKGALYSYLLGDGTFPSGTSLAKLGYTGGPLVPGASPLQEQSFDYASALPSGPEATQRAGTLGALMDAQPSFNPDPATRAAYIQNSVLNPATRYFTDTVAPEIAARYGRGGNIGAAQQTTALAGSQLASDLAGTLAGIYRGDEQLQAQSTDQARAQQLQAAGLSYNNQIGTLGFLNQLGTQQRSILGQQNAGQLNEALLGQPFADPRLSLVGLLGSPTQYQPSVVGAPNTPGAGIGVLGSLLSAFAGSGAGAAGGAQG